MFFLENLSPGKNPPEDVNVVIEIPKGSNIKYEINHFDGFLYVDRILSVKMVCPFNYGFIPKTFETSENLIYNKDSLDAFVIGIDSLFPRSVVNCIPVGVILTEDQDGFDSKIIAIPSPKTTNKFNDMRQMDNLSSSFLKKLIHFIKHHKDFEKNKFVKIREIGGKEQAKMLILKGIENYNKYMYSLKDD